MFAPILFHKRNPPRASELEWLSFFYRECSVKEDEMKELVEKFHFEKNKLIPEDYEYDDYV